MKINVCLSRWNKGLVPVLFLCNPFFTDQFFNATWFYYFSVQCTLEFAIAAARIYRSKEKTLFSYQIFAVILVTQPKTLIACQREFETANYRHINIDQTDDRNVYPLITESFSWPILAQNGNKMLGCNYSSTHWHQLWFNSIHYGSRDSESLFTWRWDILPPNLVKSRSRATLHVIMIVSLCNFTGVSAALLPRCMVNLRAIRIV